MGFGYNTESRRTVMEQSHFCSLGQVHREPDETS